jgi:hypothetical protein
VQAQEPVYATFKDRRVINTQSVEVLQAKQFDFRISHRFGDMAGSFGGWQNFFGLESAADVLIGGEYGLSNSMTIGLARTKGSADFRQLINGFAKYRVLQQTTDNKMPISMAIVGMTTMSTMKRGLDTFSLNFMPKFAHRFSYSLEMHIARKFKSFSLQLSPTFVWRNYVLNGQPNALFSLGVASRIQLTKVMGLILDVAVPLSPYYLKASNGYTVPIGVGFEFDTGGHIFQINLTNSAGIASTDYLSYTTQNWLKGEFRFGFTISRLFRF